MAFRVSPEEDAQIETAVKLTGLTKQDYIIRRLLCRDVVVQGNPRVYKALRDQLAAVLDELRRIEAGQCMNDELLDTIQMIATISRMFPISKSYLHREMDRGCKQTGVKRIRIHDLRHSHISLLIDMGFTALAIAERVGHESIDITYRYAHLFPTRQVEMADKLDSLKNEKGV